MNSDDNQDERYERKFRKATIALLEISNAIHKKKNHGIHHVYTVSALRNRLKQVQTVVDKVTDDVDRWLNNGQVPSDEYVTFLKARYDAQRQIDKVQEEINARRATPAEFLGWFSRSPEQKIAPDQVREN
jgi:hypothetical protein